MFVGPFAASQGVPVAFVQFVASIVHDAVDDAAPDQVKGAACAAPVRARRQPQAHATPDLSSPPPET
jgi:hypothetical protein